MAADGSSPHTRGAPTQHILSACGIRIIPAYAGSTATLTVASILQTDHPRIRGEHHPRHVGERAENGSSPHTRGAPFGVGDAGDETGIIPAYAGSTRAGGSWTGRRRDHPRIRGEHEPRMILPSRWSGSSPHTRGAPSQRPQVLDQGWIIPAYAGSTKPRRGSPSQSTDHPRIRGEHLPERSTSSRSTGSSPHTRGAPLARSAQALLARIIPAYAGSTGAGSPRMRIVGDHPRIRGEHIWSARRGKTREGSSPHTRGALPG